MAWSSPRTWSTSEVVTAAHMNQEVRDNLNAVLPNGVTNTSFTTQLEATTSNPTGTWVGRQNRKGAELSLWGRYSLTGNGSGTFFVTLPTAASTIAADTGVGAGSVIGSWQARDDSAVTSAGGSVLLASSTTIRFELAYYAGGQRVVDDDTPWSWASGDILSFHAAYPVA